MSHPYSAGWVGGNGPVAGFHDTFVPSPSDAHSDKKHNDTLTDDEYFGDIDNVTIQSAESQSIRRRDK